MIARLLGIRSPSRDVAAACADGIRQGLRTVETEGPVDLQTALKRFEASGMLERARRLRDLWFPD